MSNMIKSFIAVFAGMILTAILGAFLGLSIGEAISAVFAVGGIWMLVYCILEAFGIDWEEL